MEMSLETSWTDMFPIHLAHPLKVSLITSEQILDRCVDPPYQEVLLRIAFHRIAIEKERPAYAHDYSGSRSILKSTGGGNGRPDHDYGARGGFSRLRVAPLCPPLKRSAKTDRTQGAAFEKPSPVRFAPSRKGATTGPPTERTRSQGGRKLGRRLPRQPRRRPQRHAQHARPTLAGFPSAAYVPWQNFRFQHVVPVRSAVAAEMAPATANKYLAALRGVLKASWRLGQIGTENYMRAVDIPRVKGSRPSADRALDRAKSGGCSRPAPRLRRRPDSAPASAKFSPSSFSALQA